MKFKELEIGSYFYLTNEKGERFPGGYLNIKTSNNSSLFYTFDKWLDCSMEFNETVEKVEVKAPKLKDSQVKNTNTGQESTHIVAYTEVSTDICPALRILVPKDPSVCKIIVQEEGFNEVGEPQWNNLKESGFCNELITKAFLYLLQHSR